MKNEHTKEKSSDFGMGRLKMRYLYAMNSRPFSPGTYPKYGFLSVKINNDLDDCSYYDLLVYERKLDFEETLRWELEYIGAFNEI